MNKKIIFVLLISFWATASFGQDVPLAIMKAKALAKESRYDDAISSISNVMGNDDPSLYVERGELLLANGDVQHAIDDFNKANALMTGYGEYGLAKAYSKMGDAKNAVDHLEKAQKSSFKKEEKEVMLDPYFEKISGSPEWKQFVRKDWYSSLETSLSEVKYDIDVKRFSDAKLILDELKSSYGEKNTVKYLSALYDHSMGKYSSAISALSELITDEPNNMDYLLLDAEAKYLSGNYAGAASSYRSLLRSGSTDAKLYFQLARCEKNTKEYDKACNDIDTYLSIYPTDEEALQFAGEMKTAQGEYVAALGYLSQNLEANPNKAENYVKRGDVYLSAKSWNLALQDYAMALDLNPLSGETWYNKGMAHVNMQENDEACYCFKMSQKRGVSNAETMVQKYCK